MMKALVTWLMLLLTATFVQAGPPQEFRALGDGGVIDPGSPWCRTDPTGCTVTMEGRLKMQSIGTGTFKTTLTILWTEGFPNGDGGLCAPAGGEGTVMTTKGDTLTQAYHGIVCEVGAGGETAPQTFNGTYFVIRGTGRFNGSSGSGRLTLSWDAGKRLLLHAHGTLMKPEPSPTP